MPVQALVCLSYDRSCVCNLLPVHPAACRPPCPALRSGLHARFVPLPHVRHVTFLLLPFAMRLLHRQYVCVHHPLPFFCVWRYRLSSAKRAIPVWLHQSPLCVLSRKQSFRQWSCHLSIWLSPTSSRLLPCRQPFHRLRSVPYPHHPQSAPQWHPKLCRCRPAHIADFPAHPLVFSAWQEYFEGHCYHFREYFPHHCCSHSRQGVQTLLRYAPTTYCQVHHG